MKVVHSNREVPETDDDWLSHALEHEEEGEWEEAATAYEKLLKRSPRNEKIFDRLMIMYRKLKNYKKELATIDNAIQAFEIRQDTGRKPIDKKISRISNALLKATGLMNKKGGNLYQPGPVARWEKRKETVMKRLKKSNKKK